MLASVNLIAGNNCAGLAANCLSSKNARKENTNGKVESKASIGNLPTVTISLISQQLA